MLKFLWINPIRCCHHKYALIRQCLLLGWCWFEKKKFVVMMQKPAEPTGSTYQLQRWQQCNISEWRIAFCIVLLWLMSQKKMVSSYLHPKPPIFFAEKRNFQKKMHFAPNRIMLVLRLWAIFPLAFGCNVELIEHHRWRKQQIWIIYLPRP